MKGGGNRKASFPRTSMNSDQKGDALDYISSWYSSNGGLDHQTSFFGDVVEYWRSFETDSREASRLGDRKYMKGDLEDIQGLGIRHHDSHLHGIFGASNIHCRPQSSAYLNNYL